MVADLTHICQASGVGAEIKCELLPLSDAARIALGCGVGQGIASVLSGGDDYELLFSAPESSRTAILALQKELGLPVSRIGRIIEGNLVRVFTVDGEEMFLQQKGYQHFQP